MTQLVVMLVQGLGTRGYHRTICYKDCNTAVNHKQGERKSIYLQVYHGTESFCQCNFIRFKFEAQDLKSAGNECDSY